MAALTADVATRGDLSIQILLARRQMIVVAA
jgi:hypothetical protein